MSESVQHDEQGSSLQAEGLKVSRTERSEESSYFEYDAVKVGKYL